MGNTVVGFEAATFAVDQEARTISGLLLPFGVTSRPARDRVTGKAARYQFAEGSVTLPDLAEDPPILNYGHDTESLDHQIGVAIHLEITPAGVQSTWRIAKTPMGDLVLALAAADMRILRFFSAEIGGAFEPDAQGVRHAKTTTITGGAVVRKPAFEGAHITNVAASAAEEDNPVKCTKCDKVHAEGVTTCETSSPAFSADDGAQLVQQVTALAKEIADLKEIKIPVGPGTATTEVKEEPIYRFAGVEPAPSGFDFGTDLLAAVKGDDAALDRIKKFTADEAFAGPDFVTTSGTATVNPSQYRPDMFLGQAPTPASPLYNTFYKGGLSNVTPFFYAKLDRVNTTVNVGDHTEGTNPALTNLTTAVGATVTPTAMSGRVHITREVADQGGNPRVSGLIKAEFDRSFAIAKETKTAALIAAGMAGITSLTAAIAAGASGIVAGRAIRSGLVGLQFLPDGSRFTKLFGHIDLYSAMANATIPQFAGDTVGIDAYPIINPQNRDGSSGDKWSYIEVGGYRMQPAASLGATSANASNSLVADPAAVHVWNSGLTSLDKLGETVEGWDVGVFAYFAGILYDGTGLRKIAYDPTA